MNILWLTNVEIPIACEVAKIPVYNNIGWVDSYSRKIVACKENNLTVVFPYHNKINVSDGNLTVRSFNRENDSALFFELLKESRPDVIHIWGTEYSHSFYFIKECENLGWLDRTVVSIQGLCSLIGKYHYCANLPSKVLRSTTFHDALRHSNILASQAQMVRNGLMEERTLKIANHVIGRTEFDYLGSKQINENIVYHKCYESLRNAFYQSEWSLEKCVRHSIFAPHGSYPLKGMHHLIDAIRILKDKYPDIKLYAIGQDVFKIPFYRLSAYLKYIKKLIKQYELRDNIEFVGVLSEGQMVQYYEKAHVFACASSIENSSNSIGEAMTVGTPCVVSHVGGNTDFVKHEENGYVYPSDAPYYMAYYIDKIFSSDEIAIAFSKASREKSDNFYNGERNFERLIEIYNNISK